MLFRSREPAKPVTKHEAVVEGDVVRPDLLPKKEEKKDEKRTNGKDTIDARPDGGSNTDPNGRNGSDGDGASTRSWNSAGGHTPCDSSTSSADTVPISNISCPKAGCAPATRKRTRNRPRRGKQPVPTSEQHGSPQV